MAGTFLYKNTAGNTHRNRHLTNEDSFAQGMKYTDAPLPTGYAKSIVNFNLKHDGKVLTPRGGMRTVQSGVASVVALHDMVDHVVHHAHSMYVKDAADTNAILCRYFLIGGTNPVGFDMLGSRLTIEADGKYITAQYDDTAEEALKTGVLLMRPAVESMQGLDIAQPLQRSGIFCSLEANTYVLVSSEDKNTLGRIVAQFNEDHTAFHWHVKAVDPTEVQPTQAINYGYNMFKSNPYSFENTANASSAIELTGVIPYDEQGKLLLTARPGTPITFELFYKYPQADVDNGEKYLVQWEAQNLDSSADAEVLQKVRNSTVYTPGQSIKLSYTPAFTAFSLIVRLYKQSEITKSDAAWEADTALQALVSKDDNLTPNQVITLSSYYLTSNSKSTTMNVSAVAYDMGTATGMCTWQQRIVMWGVHNAKSTLFVSEVNDPGYMPYPNNSEIFTDEIICAVPYMTHLLVFTKSALYKLTINDDGISYSTQCVQERLAMTHSDANTVITVQNMVYFKSGNYFYMIVPNNASATGEMQMAPVSRPIEQMLNDMKGTLSGLLNDVYNITYDEYNNDIDLQLIDYNVYLDDTQVRNVYKVLVHMYEGAEKVTQVDYYIDISLNYDTVLRAWTAYMWETTPYRTTVFKPTVTGKTVFTHLYYNNYTIHVDLVQLDDNVPVDNIPLTNLRACKYGNHQLLETGYRTFSEDFKKRFREVQFCVNVLKDTQLKFHTAFIVDDTDVVPMYKHIVSQCTDPTDANYGAIFVERELADAVTTPSPTTLDMWELDTSVFPGISTTKVRYKVSGKGYGGSVKILSVNDTPYELLHINWIYRVMFAR